MAGEVSKYKLLITGKSMRKNCYSLVEMLVVIAIMLVMFEVAFQFFYDGSKLCTQAVEKSLSNQEMFVLSGKFRNIIHLSPDWKKEGDCLVSGQKKLMADNSRIFLIDENGKRDLALLPAGMIVSLEIEAKDNSAKLAVLNVEVKGKNNVRDRIRIVSCM
ncbi:MAG TPA: hypothetical protein DET40_14430 [Lentisphaeria bacterium]|nr:MAG: hypothetical protein A2X45_05605 [Lentisphaerae bacterium GWF2_50_93]HCE44735.1 hypothetical protein [Lentisphaeria bacterium]